jgi:O-antigen/teichoic acid export membrane protein
MNDRITIRQIILNLSSGWLASAIQMAISLALVPFLLLHLGKDGYGLIGLLTVITSITAIADLGLRSALGRELAEHVATNDKRVFSEIASTAFATYLSLGTLFSGVLFFSAPWLTQIFKIPASLQHDAVILLRLHGISSIAWSFILPVFSAGLTSHHRYDIINGLQIANGLLTGLLLFSVLSIVENPIYGWMFVAISMGCILAFSTIFAFIKVFRGNPLGLGLIRLNRLRSLLGLGGKMYALQLSNMFAERSDPLIISYFLGPSGVALYQTGQKLSQSLKPIVLTLVTQLEPVSTSFHVLGQQSQQQKLLVLGTRFTVLLGSLVTAGIISLAHPFCTLWLKASLGEETHLVARIMMLWACADLITYAAGSQFSVLLGMKKLNFLIWTQLPTALLNIFLSIYFVGFTSLGIESVLYSTILINLIRRPLVIWYTARQCDLTFYEYFVQAYARALICFAITLGVGLLVVDYVNSWHGLVIATVTITVAWAVVAFFLGLSRTEQDLLKTMLGGRMRWFPRKS